MAASEKAWLVIQCYQYRVSKYLFYVRNEYVMTFKKRFVELGKKQKNQKLLIQNVYLMSKFNTAGT